MRARVRKEAEWDTSTLKDLKSSTVAWKKRWESEDSSGRSTKMLWTQEVLLSPHTSLILYRKAKAKAKTSQMHLQEHYPPEPRGDLERIPVKDIIKKIYMDKRELKEPTALTTDLQEVETGTRDVWTVEQDNLLINSVIELSPDFPQNRIFSIIAKRHADCLPLRGANNDTRRAADKVRNRWCVICQHVLGCTKKSNLTVTAGMKKDIILQLKKYGIVSKQAATKRMMEETLKKLCSQDPTLQVREPQIPNSTTNAKNNDSIKDKQNPIKKKRRSAVKENEGTNVASVEPGGTKSRRNTKRRHHALGMVIGLN
jgi:hypothetical protein